MAQARSLVVRSALLVLVALALSSATQAQQTPVMRDFIGINIHQASIVKDGHIQDALNLYPQTTGLVRDYHKFDWDLDNTSDPLKFPTDKWGWINYTTRYGDWTSRGIQVNACIQFDNFLESDWDDAAADARAYGEAFAAAFGPTVGSGVVSSVQLGNEPGDMSDSLYRTVFQNMAEGIRAADPALKIVTCNVNPTPSGSYHKSMSLFTGLEHLVDVYATHSYPMITGWPTWERSYPEDSRMPFLTNVQDVIDWQKANDPTAETWVTEFGYDASTQDPPSTGTFKDWMDVTDTQQAQWLTRGFLNFSAMDMQRAYMYFYNDGDTPSLHASSGLTRNWNPKPVYYAQTHLKEMLGDYRFSEIIRQDGDAYVYAYVHELDPNDVMWVIWSPTGDETQKLIALSDLPGTPDWAEMMPLAAGDAPDAPFSVIGNNALMNIGESPIYLHMTVPEPATLAVLALGAAAVLRRRSR